jgi:hypothetical protein
MFGYPVPTHDEHEFTNRAACEIHKHSYSEQIVDAFKLVCFDKISGVIWRGCAAPNALYTWRGGRVPPPYPVHFR